MSNETIVSIYIVVAILIFLAGTIMTIVNDNSGKRSQSPNSTESIILSLFFISVLWGVSIVFIPFIILEDYRSGKPHISIMGDCRTRYIYEKHTKDIKTFHKARYGTRYEKAKFPFVATSEDLERARQYFKQLK